MVSSKRARTSAGERASSSSLGSASATFFLDWVAVADPGRFTAPAGAALPLLIAVVGAMFSLSLMGMESEGEESRSVEAILGGAKEDDDVGAREEGSVVVEAEGGGGAEPLTVVDSCSILRRESCLRCSREVMAPSRGF
eukprot:CAMPEP_0184362510 /NCGR_PEP_ID=MMETSP1089-20130417/135206_1 /TAXON_ID=38269 ORGANISM="Gloeochaete wittrockiana, Strain SAG46.84" /NCGR_SAMPLE_ID=MMETSP1089 /ASSEMBLY_ACC=CAM_ASM_000445 /LENGTH=138 /DNA_ID=CAMNT_0026702609 /DNA_START=93 /DNA_END=509 /DNA_ORIENTATION=+